MGRAPRLAAVLVGRSILPARHQDVSRPQGGAPGDIRQIKGGVDANNPISGSQPGHHGGTGGVRNAAYNGGDPMALGSVDCVERDKLHCRRDDGPRQDTNNLRGLREGHSEYQGRKRGNQKDEQACRPAKGKRVHEVPLRQLQSGGGAMLPGDGKVTIDDPIEGPGHDEGGRYKASAGPIHAYEIRCHDCAQNEYIDVLAKHDEEIREREIAPEPYLSWKNAPARAAVTIGSRKADDAHADVGPGPPYGPAPQCNDAENAACHNCSKRAYNSGSSGHQVGTSKITACQEDIFH